MPPPLRGVVPQGVAVAREIKRHHAHPKLHKLGENGIIPRAVLAQSMHKQHMCLGIRRFPFSDVHLAALHVHKAITHIYFFVFSNVHGAKRNKSAFCCWCFVG